MAADEDDYRTQLRAVRDELAEMRGMLFKVLDRLLDTVIPEASQVPNGVPGVVEPEDVVNDEVVGDWTDPFIGLHVDRPVNMVGRVEAGGGLPFVDEGAADEAVNAWREAGEGAFEEWVTDRYIPEVDAEDQPAAPWVTPMDLGVE